MMLHIKVEQEDASQTVWHSTSRPSAKWQLKDLLLQSVCGRAEELCFD